MEPPIYLHILGNKLLVSFKPCEYTEQKIKTISGAKKNAAFARWEVPLSNYENLTKVFDNLVLSDGVISRIREEAELKEKIEKLKSAPWYEIEDYVPKLPLYTHQKKAFELHRMLKGSSNYSEVGSGKTASAICAIHWRLIMNQIDKCLIVCPLSIIKNWQEEIARFSNMSTIAILGSKEQRLKRLEENKDIFIINYDYLAAIKDDLLKKQFPMVVLDEAHRIKNPGAEQSKAAYDLGDNADYRIALTGSPILNSPMDAFGIMRFVDPSIFGESFFAFRNKYFVNTAAGNSLFPMFHPKHGAEEKISDLLVSRSIRYLKADCLDLPPAVTLPDRVVALSAEQDKAYKQMQENFVIELAGMQTIKLTHFLSMMMKLNQITSGWFKVPDSQEIVKFKSNPKFEELKTIVEEELPGKPLIIWVYYRADIELIYNYFSRCQKCKESILRIFGDTCTCGSPIKHRPSLVYGGVKDRDAQIAWFRTTEEERKIERQKQIELGIPNKEIIKNLGELLPNGQEPPQTNIFIGQISAASEGLNLQRATYAVYFSRDYSLKNHIQSLGRNHRGGQKQTVTYINLVCARQSGDDTMDMHILSKLKKKEDMSKKINKDDLRNLFGDSKINKEKINQLLIEALDQENMAPTPEDTLVTTDTSSITESISENSGENSPPDKLFE